MPSEDLITHIRALEERLLDPAVRQSPNDVLPLLADDFVEFGCSGRSYTKAQTLEALANESSQQTRSITHFSLTTLATYQLKTHPQPQSPPPIP